MRVDDPEIARRVFYALERIQSAIYLQEFIEHPGYDFRILIMGSTHFSVRRSNPLDWRTNVSRGARCEFYQATAGEIDLARRAADATDCAVAGIDLLMGNDGRTTVVEVNAVPGWPDDGEGM